MEKIAQEIMEEYQKGLPVCSRPFKDKRTGEIVRTFSIMEINNFIEVFPCTECESFSENKATCDVCGEGL